MLLLIVPPASDEDKRKAFQNEMRMGVADIVAMLILLCLLCFSQLTPRRIRLEGKHETSLESVKQAMIMFVKNEDRRDPLRCHLVFPFGRLPASKNSATGQSFKGTVEERKMTIPYFFDALVQTWPARWSPDVDFVKLTRTYICILSSG